MEVSCSVVSPCPKCPSLARGLSNARRRWRQRRSGQSVAGIIATMTERGLPQRGHRSGVPVRGVRGRSRSAGHQPRSSPPLLRRARAVAACRGPPGGLLPLERLPGLPDLPGLGEARGGACSRRGRATAGGADGAARDRRRRRSGPALRPAEDSSTTTPATTRSARAGRRRSSRDDDRPPATPSRGRPTDPAQPAARLGGAAAVGARRAGAGAGGARARTGAPNGRARRASSPAATTRAGGSPGSAADRLADGPASAMRTTSSRACSIAPGTTRPDDELAGLVRAPSAGRPTRQRLPAAQPERPTPDGQLHPVVQHAIASGSGTRSSGHPGSTPGDTRPIPTIRSRAGLPSPPRLAVLAGALVIAAAALFFLPALLGVGGGGSTSTPERRVRARARTWPPQSAEPATPRPPSAQVYVVEGRGHDVEDRVAASA